MRSEYTYYPYDFPNDAQANVEREKLQAGAVFDKAKEQIPASRWGSKPDVERLLKQYILSVFAVFAHEACQLGRRGVWTVVRVHSECLDFLRLFSIEAHSDKGYDTNGNSLPFRPTEKDLKNSLEWKKYESERLEVAQLQSVSLKPDARESRLVKPDSPAQARDLEMTNEATTAADVRPAVGGKPPLIPTSKEPTPHDDIDIEKLADAPKVEPWHVRLRKLREQRGLSRPELAAKLGISPDGVKKHEEGYLPKPQNQQVYADFFHVPKEELFPPDR